jgi:hypothetical protein
VARCIALSLFTPSDEVVGALDTDKERIRERAQDPSSADAVIGTALSSADRASLSAAIADVSGLDLGSVGPGPFCCLPVGRLVLACVGCDGVETWIGQQLVDGRGIGSDPGPMRVDVVGDTPVVVGRPDERGVGHLQSGLTRPHLSGTPVAEVGHEPPEQEVRAVRYDDLRFVQHRGRERRRDLRPRSHGACLPVDDPCAAATPDVRAPAVPQAEVAVVSRACVPCQRLQDGAELRGFGRASGSMSTSFSRCPS